MTKKPHTRIYRTGVDPLPDDYTTPYLKESDRIRERDGALAVVLLVLDAERRGITAISFDDQRQDALACVASLAMGMKRAQDLLVELAERLAGAPDPKDVQ